MDSFNSRFFFISHQITQLSFECGDSSVMLQMKKMHAFQQFFPTFSIFFAILRSHLSYFCNRRFPHLSVAWTSVWIIILDSMETYFRAFITEAIEQKRKEASEQKLIKFFETTDTLFPFQMEPNKKMESRE